ncbi:MAG: helix-turn-helix domain-containing protein [Candidatus Bathyarchaeota archaeon]|nr:helix-turn-helix domain-containing protein [Candidatus Bathyarchaeota archaeon]
MFGSEEETYSIMFSSLKHPARRKILRMLSERTLTFSEMLEELAIPSSHLTYHLENLGELVIKNQNGKYKLSSFGKASVAMMKGAEEVPEVQSKRFSVLPMRWKSLFAIFLISIVLLASMSYIQYSSFNQLSADFAGLKQDYESLKAENQQLISWSSSASQVMTFLKDVVQIDVSKYQASLVGSPTAEVRADLGGVVEEISKYSLVNEVSRFDLNMRFRDGHFSFFELDQIEGAPNFPPIYTQPQPTSPVEASKVLIQRYQSVMNYSYLDDMLTLLASANQTGSSVQMLGNSKLEISAYGTNAEITLLYAEDGTDFSAKSIHITSHNNVITKLTDDWFLYSIGSAQVNTSQEQAIQIAKDAAENFSWNVNGTQVSNFIVLDEPATAEFYPHPKGDNLTLYPYWYVTLHLDKTYPGEVNVIAVGVWGDTGNVANIDALSGTI